MNVEFVTTDGKKGRYTGVSYVQQSRDRLGIFNDDDLGFVLADALVTYAGPGHTGTVSAADEISMKIELTDLGEEEQTTDGVLIASLSAYSTPDSEEAEAQDSPSNDEQPT